MKKRTKGIIIILSIILAVILIAGFIAGNYFYNLALNPNSNKDVVFSADHNAIESGVDVNPDIEKEQQERKKWFDESGFKDINVTSEDNLKLHAHYLKNEVPTNKWIVIFHGYGGQGSQMNYSAKRFYEMGYNVLLPDARGLGESEGHYIGMGWHERLDALKWIDYLVEEDKDSEIALYGVSMGGATVMMISGEKLPSNVKSIVEDCGYSSVWGEFAYQLNEIFNIPTFPIMNFASIVTKMKAGYFLEEGDAIKQVKNSKTPMMFIHGDNDTFVPSHMIDEVYNVANVEKEKIIVEGAGHGEAASVLGEEYWTKVSAFINKYFSK